jgi:hypothetical protein
MGNSTSSIASSPFANPGDILIAGGDVGAEVFGAIYQGLFAKSTASAQIYQLSSNSFVATSSMADDREGASGTALPDGTILVAGGYHCTNSSSEVSCTAVNTAEIYDPVAGTFSSVGPMTSKRFGQSATLISCGGCGLDGDVLIAGGDDGSLTATSTGGLDTSGEHAVNTAETYDYRTKAFTAVTATMNSAREAQAAVVIPNGGGKIALIGGDDKGFFIESLNTAEIFDPSVATFTATTGTMAEAREIAPAVALDPSIVTTSLAGQILICGGIDAVNSGTLNGTTNDTCELLDPAGGGTFSTVSGTMSSPRSGESLTLFPSGTLMGQVLIAGGLDATGTGNSTEGLSETSDNTADLFNPTGSSGALTQTGSLNEPRGGHASALLTSGADSGDVLVAGGERCVKGSGLSPNCYVVSSSADQSNGGTADGGELYSPNTGTWTALTPAMMPPVNGASGFGVPIPGPSTAGSPTATATSSGSASASPSATASSSSSASPSASASHTSAPTTTGTSAPTSSATGAPTGVPTMSATSAPTAAPTTGGASPTAAPTVSASLMVRPARMAFSNRVTTGTVTITNPNNRRQDSPLQITGASVTGNFQLGSTTCGRSVAPGGSCTFAIAFKPTGFGKSPGTFTITDNSSTHGMSTVTLMGNLVLTPLTVTPARLNFGKEPTHAPSEPQNVTVRNGNPIAVTAAISSSGPDAGDYQIGGNCSGSITANGSCTASVTFDPNATGNRRATLVISYANRKHDVALIGIGTTGGPTPTGTVAATATATPGATATGTVAATATPSSTASGSPAATPTATATIAVPTATLTIGIPTGTPTMTATSGPTSAPTPTATFTVPVPTITIALPTATATATGGPTTAPTPTATFTIPIPTISIGLPSGLATGLPLGLSAP